LYVAASKDYKDMVELLLANKADVNAKDQIGLTAFYWAANEGRKDMTEFLLAKAMSR